MLKLVIKWLLYLCAFVMIVMLLPGSILLDVKPRAFFHQLPKTFEGPLQPNDRLSQTKKLFENEISGPESLAVFDGKVVTGSTDGYIYHIDGNDVKKLVKLVDQSCSEGHYNHAKCGRPLGMKFDSKGTLYVVEPYVGVFAVKNIFEKSPKIELVLDIEETAVLGESSKFLDDLAIDEGAGRNGGHVLYVSDVSVNFGLLDYILIIMGSDMGRVIRYDINAKTFESIEDNLLFPNGVEITDDKSAILVNEFIARQVTKIYINGPKKGQSEVILKELPGEPDNIRRSASKSETYWVALLCARTLAKPNEMDYYLRKPLLRKLVLRVLHLTGSGVQFIGDMFKFSLVSEWGFHLKNGKPIEGILFEDEANDYAMIVEMDVNGNIVDSLHAPSDRSLTRLSEVREVRVNENESILYIGSYINSYLGQLSLKR